MNQSIFKSNDIRAIYPAEINEDDAYKIGRFFIEQSGAKKVVVGRDSRLSSPALAQSLARGLTEQGADVFDLGQAPTEIVYFAVGKFGYDAGIIVTASHNPKEYNGFKMIKSGKDILEWVRGKDLAGILQKKEFQNPKKTGKIKKVDVWKDFQKHIFSFVDVKKIKLLKVVIDASNGVAGKIIDLFKDKLPINIVPLNFEPDGSFPSHSPNPLLEESSRQISQKVQEEQADFGIIFDGDGDRIFLVDEKGNFIKGDISLLLLAKYFLTKEPGSGVAYNLICSKAVPDFVKKWGGRPIRRPVGFVNIREGMMEENGIMGGEVSGHYCFKDNYYCDSGQIAFLIFLQIISESGGKVSELLSEFSIYAKESEINFEVEDKEKVLEAVKQRYSDGHQDFLDGVTVEYDDWWFNVRPSNTEPLLRLTIEANTKQILEEKKRELTNFINNY